MDNNTTSQSLTKKEFAPSGMTIILLGVVVVLFAIGDFLTNFATAFCAGVSSCYSWGSFTGGAGVVGFVFYLIAAVIFPANNRSRRVSFYLTILAVLIVSFPLLSAWLLSHLPF